MALVAYDYSDDSDNNESDDATETQVISKCSSTAKTDLPAETLPVTQSTSSAGFKLPAYTGNNIEDDDVDDDSDDDDDEPINVSFSSLPKPQHDTLYVDESKVKSAKSSIWKKLISLPRASKATVTKNEKSSFGKNNTGSGLLSMLPSPSTESTKPTETLISNTRLLPTAVKNKLKEQKQGAKTNEKDDDDVSDSETDFFSLSKVDKAKECDVRNPVLDLAIESALEQIVVPKQPAAADDNSRTSQLAKYLKEEEDETASSDEMNSITDSQNQLDEEAVLKLCGRKRKGQNLDDVQVIDIREDAILAETRKNLTKRLTEEVSYRPMSRTGGPSTLSKRKHQITYLAYQAKERELELKNQWANNRFTRKQTQSKYGF